MAIDPNNLAGTAHLTFDDEFSSLSLWTGSAGTWDADAAWASTSDNGFTLSSNGEQEWYINNNYAPTSSVTPWTVSNGVLNLTGAPASPAIQSLIDGYQYTSGQLNTYHSFSQTYGYFEVNAKLPSGQGFWPAFWLMPENGGWPPELDVMEMLGNNTSTYYTTVHYNSDNESQSQAVNAGVDLSAGFHTYGVDWEPDFITWYLDGKEVYQVATPADMNTPMYMILNLALGGYWPGEVNGSTQLPGAMQVDWVRVYADGASTTGSVGSSSGSGAGSNSGSSSSGGGTAAGQTLQAPDNNGTSLTGGAGNDTLIAGYGPDVLTGGAGADIFEFPVLPWSAGHVTDFTPGVDKLDIAPLLKTYGYTDADPMADGWLSFASDGKGDTLVYFSPHDGSNSGYPYLLTTLDNVSPSQLLESRDVVVSESASGGAVSPQTGSSALAPLPTSGAWADVVNKVAGGGWMTGSPGNDYFDGGGAALNMWGGRGDDTYVVYHSTDMVHEGTRGGIDTVLSEAASYVLPANVENITLIGGGAQKATGNGLNNLMISNDHGSTLCGGPGDDVLVAGHGADVLVGGLGSDTFVYPVIPSSAGRIPDFAPGTDKLDLALLFQAAHYAGTDPLADGWLSFVDDGKGDARVYFDPHDGTNGGQPYLITTLLHVAPTSLVENRDWFFN